MRFWIDILHPSTGVKLGSGPIYTALYWEHTARISRAGQVRFGLISNDSRANLIAPKRLVQCYTSTLASSGSAPRIARWGTGIIDSIDENHDVNGSAVVDVSGDDLMRELVYRRVGKLKLSADSDEILPTLALYHDPTTKTDVDLLEDAIVLAAGQYIYVGYTEPFYGVTFEISGGNSVAATLLAQFYSYNEEWNGWQSIAITDDTVSGGAPLAKTGLISWTLPGDAWQQVGHADTRLFWIRFYAEATLSEVVVTSVAISGDGPTVTGPADIMAFAPTGWSLDTVGGSDETIKAIKHEFNGETVLAALIRLSELTGEDFRLSNSNARKITWRPAKPETGIRAVLGTAATTLLSNDAVCVIQHMRKINDTYESYVGRIYAFGEDGSTLADVTSSPPAGWSLGSTDAGHFLQHDSTWVTYGIETWEEYDTKGPDSLYEAAREDLLHKRERYEAYDVTVVKLEATVLPGDTLIVEFQRVSGVADFLLRESFTVLEITTRIDPAGIRVTRMRLGSRTDKARYPDSEDEIIGRIL